MYKSRKTELQRELPGALAGFVVFAILVAISWILGEVGLLTVGWGDITMGLLVAVPFGYLYAALNRKRKYDIVMLLMLIGYGLGAFLVEPFWPEGQFVVNLATSNSPVAFLIWIFLAAFLLIGLIGPFIYAKRTNLR